MKISALGFIDYRIPPDGEQWRIEAGERMLADFDVVGSEEQKLSEVILWHGALAGQAALWETICRLFCVNPLYGVEDPELMRPWTFEDIAAKRGVKAREVEAIFAEAKSFWRRWRAAQATVNPVPTPVVDPDQLDEPTIEKLLLQEGFFGVTGEAERRFFARRILDLEAEFQQGNQRGMARALIEQEASMVFTLNPALRSLNHEIQERVSKRQLTKELEERVSKLMQARNAAQSQIEATMKALGIAESQTGGIQKRGAFKDCLATLVEAVAVYESRGDRRLIDGVFTAGEVEILTEEFRSRSFQYRPDLPLLAPEMIENLFNSEYTPPPMARKAHRRLVAGFKLGLGLARGESGESIQELDAESADEKTEALASVAERDGDTAVISSGMGRAIARTALPDRPMPAARPDKLADY